jgi:hypothetical protein
VNRREVMSAALAAAALPQNGAPQARNPIIFADARTWQ